MTDNTIRLTNLCTNAVQAYMDARRDRGAPSCGGLISAEAANWRAWLADGFEWATVREALIKAWIANANA